MITVDTISRAIETLRQHRVAIIGTNPHPNILRPSFLHLPEDKENPRDYPGFLAEYFEL